MRNDHDMDRRADALCQFFEETGLKMIAASGRLRNAEPYMYDDESVEFLSHDSLFKQMMEITDDILKLPGASQHVLKAKITMAFFWAHIDGGVGSKDVDQCLKDLAGVLCGPFKAQVYASAIPERTK